MTESILLLSVCQHVSSDEHATMSRPFRDRARGFVAILVRSDHAVESTNPK
jgi:hypothetical protein